MLLLDLSLNGLSLFNVALEKSPWDELIQRHAKEKSSILINALYLLL